MIIEGITPVLTIIGIMMITVPFVDLLYRVEVSKWFFLVGVFCVATSIFVHKLLVKRRGVIEMTLIESLVTYSLAWIFSPLITAIPLSLELSIPYEDALFESISGFTGTGLTVLRNLDIMRRGILYWRGLMQWTGELGVIVFAAVFFPFFWRFGYILYSLERPTRISASLRETAMKIFYIYSLITATGIIICIHLGVEPLDAAVHVMTAIATGGMSNYDANYEIVFHYAPLSIYPIVFLMILGGMNFVTLSYLIDNKFRQLWGNEEFKSYLVLNFVFTILPIAIILPSVNYSIKDSFVYGVFNSLSALTTTGFSIGDIRSLNESVRLTFVLAMFIGCMSFSTGGGIKVVRLVILGKKLKSYFISFITGGAISPDVKLGDSIVEEREVANALLFIILHLAFVMIGAGLIKSIVITTDMLDAVFESTSAASNVGLSVGLSSPELPILAKFVLMVLMYLGRLEYTPLMVLIALVLYKKYRIFLTR